jgi:hypothetical protein
VIDKRDHDRRQLEPKAGNMIYCGARLLKISLRAERLFNNHCMRSRGKKWGRWSTDIMRDAAGAEYKLEISFHASFSAVEDLEWSQRNSVDLQIIKILFGCAAKQEKIKHE